ncbi:MAG: periplasmic heavy metal sensor [Hyphomicrobiales bacterium]|nr:MAG: periplasmic heavy metal sensor [Hyphomicrobiales bacterium]
MTTETPGTTPPSTRIPRWVLVVLCLSLAANVFVVGSLGAAMWRFHRAPPPEFGPPNLLGYSVSLDRDRRKQIYEGTASIRQRLRPLRQEIRQARNELTATIAADPFDATKFDAAQAQLVAKENEARELTRQLYTEIAKNLTPEERRAYGRWRERRGPPPPVGLLDDPDGPSHGGPPFRRH